MRSLPSLSGARSKGVREQSALPASVRSGARSWGKVDRALGLCFRFLGASRASQRKLTQIRPSLPLDAVPVADGVLKGGNAGGGPSLARVFRSDAPPEGNGAPVVLRPGIRAVASNHATPHGAGFTRWVAGVAGHASSSTARARRCRPPSAVADPCSTVQLAEHVLRAWLSLEASHYPRRVARVDGRGRAGAGRRTDPLTLLAVRNDGWGSHARGTLRLRRRACGGVLDSAIGGDVQA